MRFIAIACVLFSISATAQIRLSLYAGYGSYSMREMRAFQEQFKSQFNYPAEITAAFPAYPIFGGSLTKSFSEKYFGGVDFAYGSTGGRIHYSDYSGELGSDQLLRFTSLGTVLGVSVLPSGGKYMIEVSITPSIVISRLDLSLYGRVGDQMNEEKIVFRSKNLTLQPEITFIREIHRFGIQACVGYNLTAFKGKMFVEHRDAYLLDQRDRPVRAQWDGFRAAVSISYTFGRQSNSNDLL